MSGETSPLKVFVQAKREISQLFSELHAVIRDSNGFVRDDAKVRDLELISQEQRESLENYSSKTEGILEILQRDCMKVVFFGRTSNGKSTVINAMLKNKILPSGIGHTTNCFVQVEGTDSGDAYIVSEDAPNERRSIQSISHLAHALSKVRLDSDSLVRICWPKHKCSFLKDDVIFVDSPGIDVSPDMDKWIDKFCLDADVFVLVVNAESTLMQTEKNFFHRVSSRLSKPNIFILNNRWDASATEPETVEEVRQQHLERNVSFLAKELGVMEPHEAGDRVFFVSALETLQTALAGGQSSASVGNLLEGFQTRLLEFSKFEMTFQECISKTALQVKFAQHSMNAKIIAKNIASLWQGIYDVTISKRKLVGSQMVEQRDKLDFTEKQVVIVSEDMKRMIDKTTNDLHREMSMALSDEIRRLPGMLEEFERPFNPEPDDLSVYKKELNFHTEECLSRNLHFRYSSFAQDALFDTAKIMHETMSSLLPDASHVEFSSLLPNRSFEMTYHLDCPGLCAGFCEDIEFRFSLGITALVYRFLGSGRGARHLQGITEIPRSVSCGSNSSDLSTSSSPSQDTEALYIFLSKFSSVTSGTTVGSLALVAVVGKSVGWRIIAICAAVYGMLYVYERITWTKKAKEEAFKRQYIDYISWQLAQVIDLISRNCSHQVHQELSSILSRLSHHVDQKKSDLRKELANMDENIKHLNEITSKASHFKSVIEALSSKMDQFIIRYLNLTSHI